jgi:hypothetical protein
MNPEDRAWSRLHDHAAAQLSPGFAQRVLVVARAGVKAAPSFLGQFTLGAVTAALCFFAVTLFQAQRNDGEESHNLADWHKITSAAQEADVGQ